MRERTNTVDFEEVREGLARAGDVIRLHEIVLHFLLHRRLGPLGEHVSYYLRASSLFSLSPSLPLAGGAVP
jgi:hypothetical protein